MQILQVTTTLDDEALAHELARTAVTARLAACSQVGGPITSTYWWEGTVEVAREWTVVCKTTAECYDALAAHLRERHPYDVPEIVATAVVAGEAAYLAWVAREVRA